MSAELTAQELQQMTQAVDGLGKSFGTLKRSVKSLEGSGKSSLAELRSIMSGISDLKNVTDQAGQGMAIALNKIVARLQDLPRDIADAMGSGNAQVRAAGKATGEQLAQGLSAGLNKAKGTVAEAKKALQQEYEALAAMGQVKVPVLREARTAGVSLFPADRLRLKEADDSERQLQAALKRMEQRTAEVNAAANNARNASLSAGKQMVDAIRQSTQSELEARKTAEAELQAALGAMDARTKKLQAEATNARNASLSAGQQMVEIIRKNAREEVAARKTAEAELQAALGAMDARTKKLQAEATNARNASLSAGKQMVDTIRQNTREEVAAREAARAAIERQLQVDRIFNEAAAKAATRNARAQVSSATASPAGPYSNFNPSGANSVNKELARMPSLANTAAKSLADLGVDANTTHSAMRGLASGFGLLWLTWGNLAPLLTGAAISNGFVQTIKLGSAVSSTLDTIRVLSKETTQDVARLEAQMISLGKSGPFALTEISEAMKTLSLAGLTAGQVGTSIRDVLNFAIAGDTTLKASADTLTSVAKSFNYTADQFNIVSDVIAKSAAVSKSSVENMSEAFKVASVIHKQYGASLEDVGLGLAALSNLGITGSAAGTALRNMYVDLSGRTKQVADTMKKLGLEVRNANGKFPDLVTMMERVQKGLDAAGNGADRAQLKLKLFSERGSKPIIELLDALETRIVKTGDKTKTVAEQMTNALAEMRDGISRNAGFSANAAAELSLTAANQMKSVFATLQATAYEAFKSIEPNILEVSVALKKVFSSDDFKTGLHNLIVGVGELTVALVENLNVIKDLAIAYAAFKTASFAAGIFKGISAELGVMAVAAAGASAQGGVLAASGRAMAASLAPVAPAVASLGAGLATAGVSAGAAGGAFLRASGGLAAFTSVASRVIGILAGPLGIAITAAVTAWEMYTLFSDKAAASTEKHTGTRHEEFVKALRSEADAIWEKVRALEAGLSLEEYQKRKADSAKSNDALAQSEEGLTKATKAYVEAQRKLNVLEAEVANKRGGATEYDKKRKTQLDSELWAAKNAYDTLKQINAQRKAEIELEQDRIKKGNERQILLVNQNRAIEQARREEQQHLRSTGAYDPKAEETAKEAAKAALDNKLQEIQKLYQLEATAAKEATDRDSRMLEDRYSKKLITEGAYVIQSLALTEAGEQKRLAVIAEYAAREQEAYDAAQRDLARKYANQPAKLPAAQRNLQQSFETSKAGLLKDEEAIRAAALERTTKAANAAAAGIAALELTFSDFWTKMDEAKTGKTVISNLASEFGTGTDAAKAFTDAATSAYAPYITQVEKLSVTLKAAQQNAADAEAAMRDAALTMSGPDFEALATGGGADVIAGYRKQIALLTAEIEKLQNAGKTAASSAGLQNIVDKFLNSNSGDIMAKGYDKASSAVAGLVNSLFKLADAQENANNALKANAKLQEEAAKKGNSDEMIKLAQERGKINERIARNEIASYGNIASAAKTFFKEGTRGYKALETAEKVFRAFELAMNLKSMAEKIFAIETVTAAKVAGDATQASSGIAANTAEAASNIPLSISNAIAAISGQGKGDPYTAFARIAAMTALMAGLGIAVTGGGRGNSLPASNQGTGTVFGDANAKSESVNKSIDRLASNSDVGLKYSSAMLAALNSIAANIGGLTNLVLRTGDGDLTTGSSFGIKTGYASNRGSIGGALLGGLGGAAFGSAVGGASMVFGSALSSIGAIAGPVGMAVGYLVSKIPVVNKLMNALFGAKTKITGTGLAMDSQTLKSIISEGANLKNYVDVNTTKKFFGFTYSNKNRTEYSPADQQLADQFTKVFAGFNDAILSAAGPLGANLDEVKTRLDNFVIDIGRIDLKDLTGEQIQEKLTAVFGAAADSLSNAALPGLQDFQKVGEGYLETVVRVANGVEVARNALKNLGIGMIDFSKIINKQGDVAVEAIRQSLVATEVAATTTTMSKVPKQVLRSHAMSVSAGDVYESDPELTSFNGSFRNAIRNFVTNMVPVYETVIEEVETVTTKLTGVGEILQNFSGTAEELIQLYTSLVSVREGLKAIGQDAKALGVDMIQGAGGLDSLTSGLSDFYEKFLTPQEKVADMTRRMGDEFKKLGLPMPTTIEGFKNLVQTFPLLTAEQQATFGKLVTLSGGFYDLQEAMKELGGATETVKDILAERKDLEAQLADAKNAYNQATMTSAQLVKIQREGIDASNQSLFDQIQTVKRATEVANERKTLQQQLDDVTLSSTEKLEAQRNALDESNRSLFDQIQAAKAAATAESELASARQRAVAEVNSLQSQLDNLTLSPQALMDKQREALLSDDARDLFNRIKQAEKAKTIEEERYNLETQYLQATGNTAELRKRELEKIDPANRALQEKIWAYEDEQKAAEEAARAAEAAQRAAEEAAQRAQQLREAWQSVADGIVEEINRIRGLTNSPTQNLSRAQANFSIAVAKTKAGDMEAGKSLPQLSQALLTIAEDNAKSSVDLARIQARTLASLNDTLSTLAGTQGITIPGFAAGGSFGGGLRIVGEYGPELEATGPSRIYNARQTQAMLGGDNSALVAELQALRQEVAQLREQAYNVGSAQYMEAKKTNRILDGVVSSGGDAINVATPTAEPIEVKVIP